MLEIIWANLFKNEIIRYDLNCSIRKQYEFGTQFGFESGKKKFRGKRIGTKYSLEIDDEVYENLDESKLIRTVADNLVSRFDIH